MRLGRLANRPQTPGSHSQLCSGATHEQPPLERPSSKSKDDSRLLLGFFPFMFILSLRLWLYEFTQLSVTIGEHCEGLFQCLNSTFYGSALLFASIKKVFPSVRQRNYKILHSRVNILPIHLLVLFLTRGCTLPKTPICTASLRLINLSWISANPSSTLEHAAFFYIFLRIVALHYFKPLFAAHKEIVDISEQNVFIQKCWVQWHIPKPQSQ